VKRKYYVTEWKEDTNGSISRSFYDKSFSTDDLEQAKTVACEWSKTCYHVRIQRAYKSKPWVTIGSWTNGEWKEA
jgi:aromatic ring hydroxylase